MGNKRRTPDEDSNVEYHQVPTTDRPASIAPSTCASIIPFANFFCPPSTTPAHSSSKSNAAAFETLSPEEQDQVYRDLYGVDDYAVDENEEFLAMKIQELQDAINEIPEEKKRAYNLALMFDASNTTPYVQNIQFQIMFLRADKFNVANAANRLVKHFKYKLDLFGQESLARSITQNDLNDDDMDTLMAGGLRPLGHDRACRGVFWARRQDFKYKTIDNLVRSICTSNAKIFFKWLTQTSSVQDGQMKIVIGSVSEKKSCFC